MNALLAFSRAIDGLNARIGRAHDLAGAGRGADQRRQRDRPQGVRHELERVPRDAVVPVLGDLPALLAVHAAAQRAHPHRRRRRAAVEPRRRPGSTSSAPCSSCCRWRSDHVPVVDRVHALVEHQRGVDQRRRTRRLAGAAAGAGRLLPAGAAGHFAADQARRVPARAGARPERSSTIRPRRRRRSPRRSSGNEERRHDRVPDRQHGAADVRGAGRVPAARLSRSPSRSRPTASCSA